MSSVRVLCFLLFTLFSLSLQAAELIVEPDMGRTPLLHLIKHAHSTQMVMYGLTDQNFVDALIDAKNAHNDVKIILQQYPYKMADENTLAIAALQKNNVDLQFSKNFKLTHQKTFLFDHNKALVMTFNLTHSSFKNERNFAILIDDPEDIAEIDHVFMADWQGQHVQVVQKDLVWSPDNSRQKILNLIRRAQREITIYAENINDYQIIGALSNAAQAKIIVRILTSKNTLDQKNKKIKYLKKSGVDMRALKNYGAHAKVILIDNQTALLGSINLTKASLNDNRELSVITHDAKIIKQLETIFAADWSKTKAHHIRRNNHPTPRFLLKHLFSYHPRLSAHHRYHHRLPQTLRNF